MKQSTEYTIDSPYIKSILKELGFEQFPRTQTGVLMWLKSKWIDVRAYPANGGFEWVGMDIKENDAYSQDLNTYASLGLAVEAGLVESICYLSLKNKPKKYYGDDDSRPE
jgi:hypothetical protein